MDKVGALYSAETLKSFTDVLFLGNQHRMPSEIKKLLRKKKLSSSALHIDHYPQILHRLDLIGTVIIDTKDLDVGQQQKLARIIESLEMENIGVILLSDRVELPVKSFSIAPSKASFTMFTTKDATSVDDLWVRIGLNLAYRKKTDGLVVKPAVPHVQPKRSYCNKLEEQLEMTGTLVDNLAEQLRLAGMVQHDFLPSQLPNSDQVKWAASFLPAEWVSGDIYDIVRLDETNIGFYVADAVGHSMPAALLTIFLKQALVMRKTIGNDYHIFSPAEVVSNLNQKMAAQKLSGYQFATCCYCLLNTETLELTFCRAGHPYPVLLRPGEEPAQLESRGSLLGIFEQAQYVEETVQLKSGDKLLLYSDGAEPFIGKFDDAKGFDFYPDFLQAKDMHIGDMFNEMNICFRNKQIDPSEFDDITAVGLEIL